MNKLRQLINRKKSRNTLIEDVLDLAIEESTKVIEPIKEITDKKIKPTKGVKKRIKTKKK